MSIVPRLDFRDWSPSVVIRAMRWTAALWPGLLSAWSGGSPRALGLATAFAGALNLALVATWIWPQWPAGAPAGLVASAAWVLVLGLWVWGIVRLRRDWPRLFPPPENDLQIDAWFREAQTAYLRGHWSVAETLVRNILERRHGDVEASLLLASVQRRSKRCGEARQTLNDLGSDTGAARWRLEIAEELKQLAEEESESETIARAA